jgi:hypothetical protein
MNLLCGCGVGACVEGSKPARTSIVAAIRRVLMWTSVATAVLEYLPRLRVAALNSDVDYLKCIPDQGRLTHYYHFMVACLIPSVLHHRRYPRRNLVLCNDDLSDPDYAHLNMLIHYKAALPFVETTVNCTSVNATETLFLPKYDDDRGAGILRLDRHDWTELQLHMKATTPPEFDRTAMSSEGDIVVVRRRSNTPSLPARSHVLSGADRRSIVNFEEMETALRAIFGGDHVRVLVLEEMSIFEQFWAFQNARVVIGQHGAGLANAAFTNARKFIGLIEISPYVIDSRRGNFRQYSECFQYLMESTYARYIKVSQLGEFGSVNVNEVTDAVNKFLRSSKEQRLHLVAGTRVRLKCFRPKATAAFEAGDLNNRSSSDFLVREYYLGCLFPVMMYLHQHPNVSEVGICGAMMPFPFMERELRQAIPEFINYQRRCDFGTKQLPLLHNDSQGILMKIEEKDCLMTYVAKSFQSVVTPQLFKPSCCDILLVDSSVKLFSPREADLFSVTNFALLRSLLISEFSTDRVTVIRLFSLTPIERAMYFHRARVIVVREGPALVNLVFLRMGIQAKGNNANNLPKVVEFSPSRSHLEDTIDELGFRLYSSIFDKFGIECTKIHMNSVSNT